MNEDGSELLGAARCVYTTFVHCESLSNEFSGYNCSLCRVHVSGP